MSQQWYLQRSTEEAQVWRYDAILKQPFDYKAFPFDRNIIELKLIPTASASTNESDLLLPLFDAYPSMKSESLPGVFENLNGFGGWQIQETYFSYQKEDFLFHTPRLVLKYNLVVQRILTGPLISHVMPLFVVSFLTYSMLLLWAKDEKKRSLWGFNTANVLQYCASLFFILTVAHVALRDTLNAQGFVFIEYFYFITYLQILFTAMASLLYTAGINIPLIDKERGIRIKQLYWPCLLLFCVMVTLLFFQ